MKATTFILLFLIEMTPDEKVLQRCNENYDFDAQKWKSGDIPEEILDSLIIVMGQGGPHCENEYENDFITDFICEVIVNSKIGKIIKMWLKTTFYDDVKDLFD